MGGSWWGSRGAAAVSCSSREPGERPKAGGGPGVVWGAGLGSAEWELMGSPGLASVDGKSPYLVFLLSGWAGLGVGAVLEVSDSRFY